MTFRPPNDSDDSDENVIRNLSPNHRTAGTAKRRSCGRSAKISDPQSSESPLRSRDLQATRGLEREMSAVSYTPE